MSGVRSKWVCLFLLFLTILFILYINQIGSTPLCFDTNVTNTIRTLFGETTYPFFKAITVLANKFVIGIVALVTIFLLWLLTRDYLAIAVFVLCLSFGNECNKWLKVLIARPRPTLHHEVEVVSYSFPSGHAMVGSILYLMILFFLLKHIKKSWIRVCAIIVCFLLILLIGLSRIVLGVHFPTDIMAGFLLGTIWSYLWIQIYILIKKKGVYSKNG